MLFSFSNNNLHTWSKTFEVGVQMKVAIYYRVSTSDKQSIAMQQKANREYCDRENIEIYKEYSDVGISGAKESRPNFDKLLFDMRSKLFDTIVVYELSRFGRSLPHLVKLFEELKKRSVKFISVSEPMFDTSRAEGELFMHIMMALAQYERKNTIRRIHDGLKSARARGVKLGRPSGSKDKKRRKRSGYLRRWLKE